MITVDTTNQDWWFHYEYQGMNIDVQIPKTVRPESAMARAIWAIVEALDEIDAVPRS